MAHMIENRNGQDSVFVVGTLRTRPLSKRASGPRTSTGR